MGVSARGRIGAALVVALAATPGKIQAQEAPQPSPATETATEANQLPAVEVVTTDPKPKPKAKPKKSKKAAAKKSVAAPVASMPPTGPLDESTTAHAETPTSHVNGYTAKTSGAGTKTGAPIIETPQSISVVTSDQIADQAPRSLSDALRYTPGVVVELNGASSRYAEARIRGFTPVQYLDGLALPLNNFFATPRIEPYGLERIEVLKGPSSFLFGQNSPGGLLNMVSKHPLEVPLNEVELQYGSNNRFQTNFDFSGPVGPTKNFLYRVTGVLRDADTEVDHTRDDLAYIAPAFTWKPSDYTTFTLLGQYGVDYGTYPQQYLPTQGTLLPNPNGRIPRHTFLGEPGWDKFDREQWAVGYELDHKINDVFTFRSKARVFSVDNFFRAYREEGFAGPSLDTVNRGAYAQATDALSYAADNNLQADFWTGALKHEVLAGVDYYRMTGRWDFQGAAGSPINVYHPVYGAATPPLAPFVKTDATQEQDGIYAQDQVKLGGWVLTLGGRQDWAETKNKDLLNGGTQTQNDTAFTGRAGLTYVFDNGLAPYISYAESFQPIAGVGRLGNAFQPSSGRQYEAGIKYQPPGTNLLFTAAVFDILQDNVLTTDTADPNFQTQAGEARVRGFDIDARGNLTPNLQIIAGYAYLDSEITKSTVAADIGKPLDLVPMHQASAWAKYTFHEGLLNGLSIGAGVRYLGELHAPLLTPDHTLFDGLVSYDLGVIDPRFDGAELSLNVTNIFDKYYVQGYCDAIFCSLGEGRIILGSLKYRW